MPTVSDCQDRVIRLLDAVTMVAITQRKIDEHLQESFRNVPRGCEPELLSEEEPSARKCSVPDEELFKIADKHVQYTEEELKKLAKELHEDAQSLGPDYSHMADEIETMVIPEVRKLKARCDSEIAQGGGRVCVEEQAVIPELTEVVSRNIARVFETFDECMRGS